MTLSHTCVPGPADVRVAVSSLLIVLPQLLSPSVNSRSTMNNMESLSGSLQTFAALALLRFDPQRASPKAEESEHTALACARCVLGRMQSDHWMCELAVSGNSLSCRIVCPKVVPFI